MTFQLPPLGYAYDALDTVIDAKTMEIHHTKHHAGYVNNLNNALAGSTFEDKPVEYILTHLAEIPADKKQTVINNGGWHFNHTLFREWLSPDGGGEPNWSLSSEINETFGSFVTFQEQFAAEATGVFGSGRAWLCKDMVGKLVLQKTINQNNPVMEGFKPLLWLDVREHAYYLKYQNRRAEYVQARRDIVNRKKVEELYTA